MTNFSKVNTADYIRAYDSLDFETCERMIREVDKSFCSTCQMGKDTIILWTKNFKEWELKQQQQKTKELII